MWNKITTGLFRYRGKYFLNNIKDIPLLVSRFGYLVKHGYSPMAKWDYYTWFIDANKDVLTEYLKNHVGFKMIDEKQDEDWNLQAWENIIKEMIDCLDRMKEEYYKDKPCRWDDDPNNQLALLEWYDEVQSEMNKAKKRFFELLNKYFYDMWD